MGAGKKKKHQSFMVAPTAHSAPGPGGQPAPLPGQHPPAYEQALQAVNHVTGLAPDQGHQNLLALPKNT
jgi:hypothetical protein